MAERSTRLAARALVVAVAGSLAASVALGACTSLDGLSGGAADGATSMTKDDAGRSDPCQKNLDSDHDNCGACGTVCGDMEHCLAGKCAPGCPDHTVYVSADGNDNASGCTPAMPKRTASAAIALLKTLGAMKHEIHLCRGQYPESIVLDYRTSILGGYECTTWKRTANYGAPTFDGVNESVVLGAAGGPPLTIAKIDGVALDGLTFHGPDATNASSSAVVARDSANAKLSNVKIVAGGGSVAASPASVGLLVDSSAFVELTSATVDGGRGINTGGGYGSAGIYIAAKGGGVHVADTTVAGGAGKVGGGTGSVGILALGASAASTIERTNVNGGTGHTSVGSASYGIGFFSNAAADVTLSTSTITGGAGGCSNACSVTGVSISATGKVVVAGNRISGGEGKPDVADDIAFTGLHLTDFGSADVQNNFVFSGNTNASFSGSASALELTRGTTALVGGNSFALGPSRSGKGSIVVASGNSASFVNNLLFDAAPAATDAALDLDACKLNSFAMQHNVLIGFPDMNPLLRLATAPGGTCNTTVTPTVDGLETALNVNQPTPVATGNARLSAGCAGDLKCTVVQACISTEGCIGTVLASWSAMNAGDVLGIGWKLRDDVPCTISKGGLAFPGLLVVDGFGAPRTEPRSIGASEHDGSCAN